MVIKSKNWFSIKNFIYISLVFLFIFPLFSSKTLWAKDEEFLLIIFYGFLSFLISVLLFSKSKWRTVEIGSSIKFNSKWVNILTIVILTYHVFQFLLLDISSLNELIGYLMRDRVEGYLNNPLAEKSLIIKPVLDTITYVLICYFWKNRKMKTGYLLWGLVLLYTLLTSHTRFVIIIIAILPILFRHYYIKKIKSRNIIILFVIVLMFISVGNFARGGTLNASNIKDAVSIETIIDQVNRASSGSTNSLYLLYKSDVEFDYLKQYFYYLPIAFIPRVIWEEKPIVSYFWRATKEITGAYPGIGNPVLTTTIFGEMYHQAGNVGVLFSMVFYTFILLFSLKLISKFEYTELIIFQIIIHIPMDMRGGPNSFIISQVNIFLPLLLLTLLGIYKIKKRSSNIVKEQEKRNSKWIEFY